MNATALMNDPEIEVSFDLTYVNCIFPGSRILGTLVIGASESTKHVHQALDAKLCLCAHSAGAYSISISGNYQL